MQEVALPETPSRQFFTPKRKASNSLMKVSTARNVSVEKVVEEQEVNAVILPRKDPVIRKSPGNRANNSRTPMGKVIKAGGKEDAVRMRQCYVNISKGMLIASLFLYFFPSTTIVKLRERKGKRVDSGSRLSIVNCRFLIVDCRFI